MVDRKEQERHFHDHLREELPYQRYSREVEDELKDDPRWRNLKVYSIEKDSRKYVEDWIRDRCMGKRILDYGCGNGEDAMFAAEHGATAVGIDISDISISNCRAGAEARSLSDRASFYVMDAEKLEFEDNSFDLVVVYGVLHHLDFAAAMSEISRVLKSGGQAICTEALAHNPVIHQYRKRTLDLRTPWEVDHIMRKETIFSAANYFENIEIKFYHLATLLAIPFRRIPGFPALLSLLGMVDSLLLRLPWIRWQAWQAVFELSNPIKRT